MAVKNKKTKQNKNKNQRTLEEEITIDEPKRKENFPQLQF